MTSPVLACGFSGRVTVNTLPSPQRLSASMRTAHQGRQSTADRQAEAGAFVIARQVGVDLAERA